MDVHNAMRLQLLLTLKFAQNKFPNIDLISLPHLFPLSVTQVILLYYIPVLAPRTTSDAIQLYLRKQMILNLGVFQ